MARFTIPAERFPWSPVQIRTRAGLVDFVDHAFETDDEGLAAALREVPHVFGIVEEGEQSEQDDDPGELERPSVRAAKADWVAFAVSHSDESKRLSEEDAAAMTKADLVELYGG
ncbi:hypothetical protein OHR68_09940 [Spirillospora sp. NBC_00431]